MTKPLTLQTLATEVKAQFVRTMGNKDREFWIRESPADDWISDLCREAHGDMLPDDWRYDFIVEALDVISDYENMDDARDSLEADIYTSALIAWLGSHGHRPSYCDDAVEEMGIGGSAGIITRMQAGQLVEKREVFDEVLTALNSRLDVLETRYIDDY